MTSPRCCSSAGPPVSRWSLNWWAPRWPPCRRGRPPQAPRGPGRCAVCRYRGRQGRSPGQSGRSARRRGRPCSRGRTTNPRRPRSAGRRVRRLAADGNGRAPPGSAPRVQPRRGTGRSTPAPTSGAPSNGSPSSANAGFTVVDMVEGHTPNPTVIAPAGQPLASPFPVAPPRKPKAATGEGRNLKILVGGMLAIAVVATILLAILWG